MNLSQLSKSVYEETSVALYNNTPNIIKENMNTVVDVFNHQTNIFKKKYTFREKFSLEQRNHESNKILTKYPTKIPIICERLNGEVKDLDRHKSVSYTHLTLPTSDLV